MLTTVLAIAKVTRQAYHSWPITKNTYNSVNLSEQYIYKLEKNKNTLHTDDWVCKSARLSIWHVNILLTRF